MTSRPDRKRPSPSPRWRTSCSSNRRASPLAPCKSAFKRKETADIPQAGFPEGRYFTNFDRPRKFLADGRSNIPSAASPLNSRPIEPSGPSSRSYWNLSTNNAGKHVLPQKRVSRNDSRDDQRPSGLKRSASHEFFPDFPPTKQMRHLETRRGMQRHSGSLNQSSSNVMWRSPPCRHRSHSRERNLSFQPVSQNYEYEKLYQDRDSKSSQRRADPSLKGPGQSSDRQTSHHQNTNRHYDDLEKRSRWYGAQYGPQGTEKTPFNSNVDLKKRRDFSEYLSRGRFKNARGLRRSPLVPYKPNRRGEFFSLLNRGTHRKGFSVPGRIRHLQDSHQRKDTSLSSEQESCNKTQTTRKDQHCDKMPGVDAKEKSKDPALRSQSSSTNSYSCANNSWSRVKSKGQARSGSLSSVSQRSRCASKVSTCRGSAERNRSLDSSHSSTGVKVKPQVLEFNPDYVVIIRRSGEGARPLCSREEFSETIPVDETNNQASVKNENCSPGKSSISKSVPREADREADNLDANLSTVKKDCPAKISPKKTRVPMEAEKSLDNKPSLFDKTSVSEDNSSSTLSGTEDNGKRTVASARAKHDSVSELTDLHLRQTDKSSEIAEEDSVVTSKKYDLRQKISERRLLRSGRSDSSKLVRKFPYRWKSSLSQANSRPWSMTAHQNLSFEQRSVEDRHSFITRKVESRRSVVLKQSFRVPLDSNDGDTFD